MQHRVYLIGLSGIVAVNFLFAMDSARLSRQDLQNGVKTSINGVLTNREQIEDKIAILEETCERSRQVIATGKVVMPSGKERILPDNELATRPILIQKLEEEIVQLRKRLAAIEMEQVEQLELDAERKVHRCCWRRC